VVTKCDPPAALRPHRRVISRIPRHRPHRRAIGARRVIGRIAAPSPHRPVIGRIAAPFALARRHPVRAIAHTIRTASSNGTLAAAGLGTLSSGNRD